MAEQIIRIQEGVSFDLIPEGSVVLKTLDKKYGITSWRVQTPAFLLETDYGSLRLRHASTSQLGNRNAGVSIDPFTRGFSFNNEDVIEEERVLKYKRNQSSQITKVGFPTLAVESYKHNSDDKHRMRILSPEDSLYGKVLDRLRLQIGFPDLEFEALPNAPKVRFYSFFPFETGPLPTGGVVGLAGGYHVRLPEGEPLPLVRGRLYFTD